MTLAVDEAMLREPRLLVPGMQPLGPVIFDNVLLKYAPYAYVMNGSAHQGGPLLPSNTVADGVKVTNLNISGPDTSRAQKPKSSGGALILSVKHVLDYLAPCFIVSGSSYTYLSSDYVSLEYYDGTWTSVVAKIRINSTNELNYVISGSPTLKDFIVLTGGPRGAEVWKNGNLLTSAATTKWTADFLDTATWQWINKLNRGSTQTSSKSIALALQLNVQPPAEIARALSINPYQFLTVA